MSTPLKQKLCIFSLFLAIALISTPMYAQNSVNAALDAAESSEVEVAPLEEKIILEAHVIQIVLNDEHRSGVDWGAIVSDFHTINLKKEENPIWADKKYKMSVGKVSDEDYAVLLEALDTVGHMMQYPQTSIPLKKDQNTTAHLKVGSDDQTQDIRLELLVSKLKSGDLSLKVEPHMTLLGSDIKGNQRALISLALKAQTDIVLKDNTTIILGSLIHEEEITKTHKFPLLGDLPLVGLVFRNQGRWMQKTETVMFLTVRMKAGHENL